MATSSKSKATAAQKTTKKATASKATTKAASAKKSTDGKMTAKAPAKSAVPKNGASKARKATQTKKSDLIVTHDMIASKAYTIWAENGYVHGMELQNWLQAEKELRAGM